MPATFLRYFSILLFTFGLSIVAHSVLAADDPSTKGLSESTRLLFKAINENNIESARAAVSQGANINAENSLGVRPVDLAVDLGYFDVAHFLLAANRAPEKKEEEIPLPPPMIPLAAQGNTGTDLPPILSGPQVSVPAVSSAPLPAIRAPQISAPKISAPRISAPKFAAPRISAPKIVAPAPPPAISPPAISAPRISAPRIAAPKIAPAAPSVPRISAPTFRAPTLPAAPTRAENLPIERAVPVPPKISEMPSTKPGSVPNLEIIAPPEPPPLTTEDGTVVQTPDPLKSTRTTTTIASPPAQATGSPSRPPESGDKGFMSNVWDSMTGWIPFTGNDSEESVTPKKQSKPVAPDRTISVPTLEKPTAPPATVVKDPPRKTEKGFLSNTWDSMTDWVPSSDDSKKNSEIKASPTAPHLRLSPKAPSTSILAPKAGKQSSVVPNEAKNEPVPAITLARLNNNSRPLPEPAPPQQKASQKIRQERAMLAAKQRAEAELSPRVATNFVKPEPKKKVYLPTKSKSLEAQNLAQSAKITPAPEPPVAKPSIKISKVETSLPKVHNLENVKEGVSPLLNNVNRSNIESVREPKPPSSPPPEKKGVLARLGDFFTSRREAEPEDTDIIAEQPTKIDVAPKESFSEISTSKNSSSYANLPLPEPPPVAKTISIPKSIKLVVGTKSRLGKDLNVDLVEDSKCVEKTRHNILFCLERVSWPSEISKNLKSPLSLMGDNMAMIRYDGGKASQIHLNFPTDAFDTLIEYFEKKYGPPTEYPKILMRRIGVPPKENPTVRWRVANPEMKRDVILEIRKTDDLRSILPAEGTGVARLYSYGDGMIFRYVSTADIMLMRMKYSTTRRRKRTN